MAQPELNQDVTADILLRIPPDEPEHLIRASLVCKLWHRVVSDPAFLRRYSAFHRGAPLLGFFYNHDVPGPFPGFVPTTAAYSPPQPRRGSGRNRWVPDCRHGRVIFREVGSRNLAVWDPFSNHWEELQAPNTWYAFHSNTVVLCAVPGCDHLSCRGGPFLVVCLSIDDSDYTTVHAHVYSSESRVWCTPASLQLDSRDYLFDTKRAAVIGDGIYCVVHYGTKILKYDLVEHRLSIIGMPTELSDNGPVLMQNEDGSLGIAGVLGSRLCLWSTMVDAEGVTGWVQQRVIELEGIFPLDITSDQANMIAFAEGVEVFFISTDDGAFTYDLKPGRVRKVGEPMDYHGVTPFISFVTPDGQSNHCLAQTKNGSIWPLYKFIKLTLSKLYNVTYSIG